MSLAPYLRHPETNKALADDAPGLVPWAFRIVGKSSEGVIGASIVIHHIIVELMILLCLGFQQQLNSGLHLQKENAFKVFVVVC